MAFGSSATLTFDIFARDHGADKTFGQIGNTAQRTGGRLGVLGGKMSSLGTKFKAFARVGALAAVGAGAFAVKVGVDSVKAASDLNETISKSEQIFGKSAKAMIAMAETADKRFGMSKQAALDAASTFGVFGKSAGLAGKNLTKFSGDFVGLAADMASFNNTSPEEAIQAIGAGLRGESEPLRRYGILLNDATLRQEALKLGLIETTSQALTPQQKVLASQAAIWAQAGDQVGDFTRTSDGLANQQRILAAQLDNVKASMGQKLLPIAVKLFTWMNDKGIPAAQKLGQWFSSHLGPAMSAVGGVIANHLMPFLAKVGAALADDMPMAISAVKGAFADAKPMLTLVGKVFSNILGPALLWLAENVIPVVVTQMRLMGKVWGAIGRMATWVWNNLWQPVFHFLVSGIATVLDMWAKMLSTLAKVPGFGWAKDAAKKMADAADKADALANNIKKIPDTKNVQVNVKYNYSGLKDPTRGQGGDPGLPPPTLRGNSGRFSTDSRGLMSGGGRQRITARDLDGLEIRVTGVDPGMKAYMFNGGTGRY